MNEAARAAAETEPTSIVDDFLRSSAAYATAVTRSRYTEACRPTAVAARGVEAHVPAGRDRPLADGK